MCVFTEIQTSLFSQDIRKTLMNIHDSHNSTVTLLIDALKSRKNAERDKCHWWRIEKAVTARIALLPSRCLTLSLRPAHRLVLSWCGDVRYWKRRRTNKISFNHFSRKNIFACHSKLNLPREKKKCSHRNIKCTTVWFRIWPVWQKRGRFVNSHVPDNKERTGCVHMLEFTAFSRA